MGVTAILGQDPHSRPATTDRSPAPFVHASDDFTIGGPEIPADGPARKRTRRGRGGGG